MKDANRTDGLAVVSFGGGVNSSALLIGMAMRGLKPDLILFSDTGGEKPETYEHLEVMQTWCVENSMPEIEVVSYSTSLHGTLENECLNNETLPSKAFGFGGCSVKWKRQPMDKRVAAWEPAKAAWGRGEKVGRLIGLHAGEMRRGKIPDDAKYNYRYPLREWGWQQEDCEAAIRGAGLRVPVKSACFYCPAMRKAEVIQLSEQHPELFQRAVEMERNANAAGNLETVKGLGRHWTWENLVAGDRAQLRLFRDDQAPQCDTCFDG